MKTKGYRMPHLGTLESESEHEEAEVVYATHLEDESEELQALESFYTAEMLLDQLITHGVERAVAREIVAHAAPGGNGRMNAEKYLSKGLEGVFEFNSLLPLKNKVVAFVGSQGAGKTTTIAKLSARLHEVFDFKIALISLNDTERSGGYHLETYASILNVPFRSINPKSKDVATQIEKALFAFDKFDLVFIDTPDATVGSKQNSELNKLLGYMPDAERMLVMGAPNNATLQKKAGVIATTLDIDRVVVTKVDEAGLIGPLVNSLYRINRPVAFITTGELVPEDVEPASARRIAWMLSRIVH